MPVRTFQCSPKAREEQASVERRQEGDVRDLGALSENGVSEYHFFFFFFFWKYNNLSLPRKIPFDLCLLSPLERNSVVSGNVQGWMLTDTGNGERA